MEKQRPYKLRVTLISAVILIVGIFAISLYLGRLNDMIEDMTVYNVKQIAAHDLKSIEAQTSNIWDTLTGTYKRVLEDHPAGMDTVCERLKKEAASVMFNEVMLIDDKGDIYSGSGTVINGSGSDIVCRLLGGQEKAVQGTTRQGDDLFTNDVICYGVLGEPIKVGDTGFVGMICLTPIKYTEQHINIKSYDGEGLSSVFDMDGYYVIAPDNASEMIEHDNFFDRLRKDYGCGDNYIADLKEKILSNEEICEVIRSDRSGDRITYYKKVTNADWIFCTSIPESVVTKDAQPFIIMTVIATVLLLILITIFFIVLFRSVIASANARSRAKAHSDFLSAMSHELRTPLNAIIGFNELLRKRSDDKEKSEEYLNKSESTAKYMLSLINDILDMSKIRAGKIDIENAPFSLSASINTMSAITHAQMEKKNIGFTVDTELTADNIIGDETHIEQILLNILGNASKFTSENGKVELIVRQTEEVDGAVTTVFTVEDNGIGMTDEFQRHIFDEFSQERGATSNSIKGTGLGMALSYMYARAMGGDLIVKSTLGKGSTFIFTITNEVCAEEETAASEDTAPCDTGKRLNILIAEDNDFNAEIIMDTLELENISTVRAADGKEAVRIFGESGEGEFDLILMDIMMPEMDGYEAAKAIRALDRPDAVTVPIYACSANTFIEDKEKAYECGMNDYITKPIDTEKLIHKLEKLRK